MKRWKMFLFGASLLAFGIGSTGAVRPLAAQAAECPGTTQPLCAESTESTCTNLTICGFRATWPLGLILCCAETTTTTDYYYYPADY